MEGPVVWLHNMPQVTHGNMGTLNFKMLFWLNEVKIHKGWCDVGQ